MGKIIIVVITATLLAGCGSPHLPGRSPEDLARNRAECERWKGRAELVATAADGTKLWLARDYQSADYGYFAPVYLLITIEVPTDEGVAAP
jgi:hypothetical protein